MRRRSPAAVSGGTTVIAYDAAGREISLTDPDNNKTQWAYDADDRVTTETLPNSATVTYVYDNDGELTDTTDADGRRTTYSYDADGDQTGETWVGASPSEKITYTYDADNELTGAADAYATLTFTYDSGGNELTSATSGPGTGQPSVTLTSTYNPQNNLASVTDNISGNVGITTYVYDAGQRLTTITTSYGGTAGPEIVTSYAPNNQISAQSRTIGGSGTAVNTSYSYDAADRQTTITDYVSGGSALATYVYSYDNANRVTTMVDAEGTYTYTYDNANELTSVDKGGTQVESYAYDANGNRTGTGYSTTVMNETLTSPGVVTYTYDYAGNMISANSGGTITTYTYDYRNRLTGVKQGGTVIATYTYNALDQRIGIQDSGGSTTWTVYNGTSADALPYADFNGSGGALLTRYVSGPGMVNGAVVDELLARTSSGGTTAWYLTDKLDSVRDVVSSAGSVLDHVVYDSFGNITTETNASNGDRFKFAGMEYDATTGQYYDHARWYGAGSGRFDDRDPLGLARVLVTSIRTCPMTQSADIRPDWRVTDAANRPTERRDRRRAPSLEDEINQSNFQPSSGNGGLPDLDIHNEVPSPVAPLPRIDSLPWTPNPGQLGNGYVPSVDDLVNNPQYAVVRGVGTILATASNTGAVHETGFLIYFNVNTGEVRPGILLSGNADQLRSSYRSCPRRSHILFGGRPSEWKGLDPGGDSSLSPERSRWNNRPKILR